jgi:small redox-active disulfide protein 2
MKKLTVLGPGCPNCRKLAQNTEEAAKALGIEYEIVKVTDIDAILDAGVMTTPALVVDGEVKVAGRVPTPDEIKTMLG